MSNDRSLHPAAQIESLKAPERFLWRAWLPALLAVLVATAVFVELAGDVWLQEGFSWDAPLMLAIHRTAIPAWTW